MMNSGISIIIPFYNSDEYLEKCIISVLNQTIFNSDCYDENFIQVILIDDGSTDNSSKIAKKYAEKYNFIEYHYQNHQGLNNSYNNGAAFANGKYLSFLNANDNISRDFYEDMYKLAERNCSDLTTSFVCDFNYGKCENSNIYKTAFLHEEHVLTIKKSFDLLYDNLLNNKLIRHSFFKENNLNFCEKNEHQDFSTVFKMQYLANSISMINQPSYFLRIPDKIESNEDIKDKLSIMRAIDEFIKENINDSELQQFNEIKWLKADLMKYIDDLIFLPKKDSKLRLDIIKDFIENYIDLNNIGNLNEIDQQKYNYLLNSEYEKLFDLLRFVNFDLESSNLNTENSSTVVENDVFTNHSVKIDQFIKEGQLFKSVKKVKIKKGYVIEGFALIPGLNNVNFNDRTLTFYIYNTNTQKKFKINHENIKYENLYHYGIPYGRQFSYDASGFRIHIPYDELYSDELDGKNRILINYKHGDVEHNSFLDYMKITDFEPISISYKEKYFLIKLDVNNDLIIDISKRDYFNEKISIEDEKLSIYSKDNIGELFIYYNDLNEKIPLNYDAENQCYCVELDSMSNSKAIIINENDDYIIHKKKQLKCLNSKKGQVIIDSLVDNVLKISKCDVVSTISDVNQNSNRITITVDSNHVEKYEGRLKSAKLYFKNELNRENNLLSNAKIDGDKLKFTLDLSDDEITKNLSNGIFNLKILHDFNGDALTTPVYALDTVNIDHEEPYFKYKLYRSKNHQLKIQSKLKWPNFENTDKKRRFIEDKIYKLFRLLPINNKQVMFESMWGKKYSCNPRYLYEYINDNHPDWKCIWSFIDEHTPMKGNGIKVRRNSLKYYYYLATSKILINNGSFFDGYEKRNKQIQVQTMHGMGCKTLGMDAYGEYESEESKREFMEKSALWDYVTIQSDFYVNVTKSAYGYENEHLKFGYPRTDILLQKNNPEEITRLKKKFNIPLDKKVILYAPTWRVRNSFDLMLDLEYLEKELSDEYVLILRRHHATVKNWKKFNEDFIYDYSNYDVAEDLFLISDILISDYSSVMFDFTLLNRPILIFAYDLDEYQNYLRGSYFDLRRNNPGPILYTSKEVADAILNIDKIDEEYKECREKFINKFLKYDCKNSSEKIFKAITEK
ncbi:MAG: glycosyltransferase [Methanobrevibacter sp.]|nr:CDP-glycerol glycerophosphotransferase family protein [Methanobrevibacter sp.]MBE6490801.1 glycosyltransferase [Methanobrevibacter sp.]